MKNIAKKLYATTTTELAEIIKHSHSLGLRTDVEQIGPTKKFYGITDITFQITVYTILEEENAK